MKNTSIKIAILLPAISVLIVGIIGMMAIVGILSFSATQDLTDRLIDARVKEYTNEFEAISLEAYGVVSSLAPIVKNVAAIANQPRKEIVEVLQGALEGSDTILSVWTCWEPDALDSQDSSFINAPYHDGTGRFIPYITRSGSGYTVEALTGYADAVEGDYYLGARNSGKPYITDPYLYDFVGTSYVVYTISIPIVQNGQVLGVVGVDINTETLIQAMNQGSILDDGYIYTLSPGGFITTHPTATVLLEDFRNNWLGAYTADMEKLLSNGGTFSVEAYSAQSGENMHFLANGIKVGDTGNYWAICGVVPVRTVTASSYTLLFSVIGIGVFLTLAVGITTFLIIRKQLSELPVLTATAEALAIGDIGAAKTDVDRNIKTKNEILQLKRAFALMADGISQQADVLTEISQGDYSMTIPVRSEADVMNKAIGSMLDSSNSMLFDVQQASSQVAVGSSQIADAATNLAIGSTEQAATLQQFSASISEIHAQSEDSAQLAQHAKNATDQVEQYMGKSIERMDELTRAMNTIGTNTQKIEKVIKVIDDIAFQTNILALNAAVEAARAAQHGKGFAVVAEEVRTLAAKSAVAASETASLIENCVTSVQRGTEIAGQTAESLTEAGKLTQENASDLDKLNIVSQHTTEAITAINTAVGQISEVVQANSATAEESAASAEEMSAQSDALNEIIDRFSLRQQSSSSIKPPKKDSVYFLESSEASPTDAEYGKY